MSVRGTTVAMAGLMTSPGTFVAIRFTKKMRPKAAVNAAYAS
jgi:uncharacterized membrane protein YhfC